NHRSKASYLGSSPVNAASLFVSPFIITEDITHAHGTPFRRGSKEERSQSRSRYGNRMQKRSKMQTSPTIFGGVVLAPALFAQQLLGSREDAWTPPITD
ncbi:MAG: hypothetical protein ACPIOQ_31330, partial [Promethearchaeia archaeon]